MPVAAAAVMVGSVLGANCVAPSAKPAAEYAKHLDALSWLSMAVAQSMPGDQYSFQPHPESMTFGELMLPFEAQTTLSAPG
jgi:hypothetical protein